VEKFAGNLKIVTKKFAGNLNIPYLCTHKPQRTV